MKKKHFFNIILCAFSIYSCSQVELSDNQVEDVQIYLDYTFSDSGSMYTKSESGDVAFQEFKKNYIDTRKVTPSKFTLMFSKKDDPNIVFNLSGHWDKQEGFRLPEGTYNVKGVSEPAVRGTSSKYYYCTDTAYISFNETVSIIKGMDRVALKAEYNSYLLLFDKSKIKEVTHSETSPEVFNSTENVIYGFISDRISQSSYSVFVRNKDGDLSHIYLNRFNGKKGMYYYFKNIDYSYELPEMQPGN